MRRAVRIVDIGEEHVPRVLSVDANRLNPLENSVTRPFQHRPVAPLFIESSVAYADLLAQHKTRLNGKKNGVSGSSCGIRRLPYSSRKFSNWPGVNLFS